MILIPVFITALVACSPLKLVNLFGSRAGYERITDVAYAEEPRHTMDIYLPRTGLPPTAVLVFFYGGSWQRGNKEDYGFVARALTRRGFVVVIPDYRLYPEAVYPDFVDDGAAAVVWVQTNLHRYTGTRLPLFVGGHSAGAHIAAMINYDEQFLLAAGGGPGSISGFIGLAGPYDFLPIKSPDLLKVFGATENHPLSQPVNFVDGAEAPALLIHGSSDKTVWPHNSKRLSAAIRGNGGSVKSLYLDGKNHTSLLLAFIAPLSTRSDIIDRIEQFMRTHAQNPNQGRPR